VLVGDVRDAVAGVDLLGLGVGDDAGRGGVSGVQTRAVLVVAKAPGVR